MFARFQIMTTFAIITNIYRYEKHISLRLESLYGWIQEHDVGEAPMVADSPEGRNSFPCVADFLLPTRIGREER